MFNLLRLRPSELCQLLNATPLGEVVSERQIRAERSRVGLKIGDGQHINLLRYIAWLVLRRAARAESYESIKDKSNARNKRLSRAARDIGGYAPPANPERKERARHQFRFFCETYFPTTFSLPWSADHLKVIAKIEQAVLHGGLFAVAMPRGSGKTSICECACIWAVLYGHRDFVCLIGSDEGHAAAMLDAIKVELETNDLLHQDFEEVTKPIRALEGIANRCAGQLSNGERTHITWTAKEIVLPTMRGSAASGAIIKVAGITGRIRGMKHKRADGRAVRPSLVIIDDPQTDESARSPSQCASREAILSGAVLGLAGPGKKISGIMPCTVIQRGDMADNILDRVKHPEWNGERYKMVYSFPINDKLWQRYAEIRAESFRRGNGGREATEFYRQHRAEMDEGAVVAWPERFNHDEISAIQHAMNLKLRDEQAFFAEYQNEPLVRDDKTVSLTPEIVLARLTQQPFGAVPAHCSTVTIGVDVQGELLYWLAVAWTNEFGGVIFSYGTWPRQPTNYFLLSSAKATLSAMFPALSPEARIYQGIHALVNELTKNNWPIAKIGIDANWGPMTERIYRAIQESPQRHTLLPMHGRGIGASSIPMSEWRVRRELGERAGDNWMLRMMPRHQCRACLFDANAWKSVVHGKLTMSAGESSALMLAGDTGLYHRLLADHLTSEYPIRTTAANGRTADEWKLKEARENHWWDCLVIAAVCASVSGIVHAHNILSLASARKKPTNLSEIQWRTQNWK